MWTQQNTNKIFAFSRIQTYVVPIYFPNYIRITDVMDVVKDSECWEIVLNRFLPFPLTSAPAHPIFSTEFQEQALRFNKAMEEEQQQLLKTDKIHHLC